ncbi:MAG TPA: hypothetical protein PKI42_00785 [Cyclobacteriaceae bacterium]|nr:hypothetical protein [Cyclobacteriaceae bacterium]
MKAEKIKMISEHSTPSGSCLISLPNFLLTFGSFGFGRVPPVGDALKMTQAIPKGLNIYRRFPEEKVHDPEGVEHKIRVIGLIKPIFLISRRLQNSPHYLPPVVLPGVPINRYLRGYY